MASRFGSIDHLSLPVRDLEGARQFYRDFLGLHEGYVSDHVVGFRAGEALLALSKREHGPPPEGLHFGFREQSREAVDEWARRVQERGLTITDGPKDEEWGRALYFQDPEGYEIQIWAP